MIAQSDWQRTQQDQGLGIAEASLRWAENVLPRYTRSQCPHKFTQPQLLACLVLREYLDTTYRGIIRLLVDSDELRKILRFDLVPHYSTLKHFADRSNGLEMSRKFLEGFSMGIESESVHPIQISLEMSRSELPLSFSQAVTV